MVLLPTSNRLPPAGVLFEEIDSMHLAGSFRFGLLTVALVALVGCSGGDSTQSGSSSGGGGASAMTVDVSTLPKLDEPFTPLDEGRLVVCPPKDWRIPARSDKYLVRFAKFKDETYPTIIVTGEDYEPVFNVDQQNLGKFQQAVADELSETSKQQIAIDRIAVGKFLGVMYLRRAKAHGQFKDFIVDCTTLDTVVAGRRYKLELRCRSDDTARYRPELWAVAQGLQFPMAAGAQAPATQPNEPAAEQPGDEKPGEEKPDEKKPDDGKESPADSLLDDFKLDDMEPK